MSTIILASQSPRRQDLLTQMGVTFVTIPSNFDEQLDDSRDPETVATELALGKALAVARSYPDSIVIGSDTIVTVAGRQLEKPRDADDALEMLQLLAGKANEVSTGLAVVRFSDGTRLTSADTTRVHFKPYDETLTRQYVATGDPLDKAGAYGIQSGAAPLIDRIEGNYDTILGLPTGLLAQLLTEVGVRAVSVTLEVPVVQLRRP
jgi:septum formation protein